MPHALKTPANLEIAAPNGLATGGSQLWYADKWQRMSGCGPTAAANLVWYLNAEKDFAAYRALQDEMFGYVTPGMGGVNSSRIFTDGVSAYARAHNSAFAPHALDIPQLGRPPWNTAEAFVSSGLDSDSPVAFLNLSNGNQRQLDSWHWVTIIGLDGTQAHISDQGRTLRLDLKEWLASSMLGGAFVYVGR